jgi:hypothetical protein
MSDDDNNEVDIDSKAVPDLPLYEIVNHVMILKIRLSGESRRWDVMVDKVEKYLIAELDHKNMN